jgi:hypothetical protein
MQAQYKHMAEFCRTKIEGGPNDAHWAKLAAHWDRLHDGHSWTAKRSPLPQTKPEAKKK